MNRVLVAMSGGVDSSIAAAILKEKGYDVIGATMKIWPEEYCGKSKEKACCSLDDIADAKKVCDRLGIRHYTLNFEKVFREKVIDYFTKEYLAGRTPNPCIVCNEKIKFGAFLEKAKELDSDFVCTGHYARIERNGYCRLRESADKTKDQSYVLFSLTSVQMEKVLLPVGEMTKDQVRDKAKKIGLTVYKKLDSQEICFVPDNNYSDFIKGHCRIGDRKGDVVDTRGKILGSHSGFWNFTIGQRKGLGIAHKHPLYVISIDAKRNIVVAGTSKDVKRSSFTVKDVNWCAKDENIDGRDIKVKIRYNHNRKEAHIRKTENGKLKVRFEDPQEAITPGQAAVFYEGEYVIGGGWIDEVLD